MHDVIVVGGGPTGCYTAALMARAGLDVVVLEEHEVIGKPVDCSGVIGAEAFSECFPPGKSIVGDVSLVHLISPGGLVASHRGESPLAYIVDRATFDQEILEMAVEAGAAVKVRARVKGVTVDGGGVAVDITRERGDRERLSAALLILACGPRYAIQRELGLGAPRGLLRTSQVEVIAFPFDGARVFFGERRAGRSFAWVVPFTRDDQSYARVGVAAKGIPTVPLRALLQDLEDQRLIPPQEVRLRSWVIPMTPIRRTYGERVLAVGDAAGQVKPTTGGGLFYGLLCAKLAAETAVRACEAGQFGGDFLSRYERAWRRRLGVEMRVGSLFRRLFSSLRDEEIDHFFQELTSDGILARLQEKVRFDWHKDLIWALLRHPGLGMILLRGVIRWE